jgi:hypothetical protein
LLSRPEPSFFLAEGRRLDRLPRVAAIEVKRAAYTKWVAEGVAEFQAGNVLEVVKRCPLIVSEDVP